MFLFSNWWKLICWLVCSNEIMFWFVVGGDSIKGFGVLFVLLFELEGVESWVICMNLFIVKYLVYYEVIKIIYLVDFYLFFIFFGIL